MRKGDFANVDKQTFRHVPATKKYLCYIVYIYLHKAVSFFLERFYNHRCIRFIIAGEDYERNLQNHAKQKKRDHFKASN